MVKSLLEAFPGQTDDEPERIDCQWEEENGETSLTEETAASARALLRELEEQGREEEARKLRKALSDLDNPPLF